MSGRGVLRSVVTVLAVLSQVSTIASAQTDLNCDDFANQAEAQASLNETYPDDPHGLDRDKDWIACEDFFDLTAEEEARVVPANLASGAGQSAPETTPVPTAVPESPLPVPPSSVAGSRVDPPADLMAQVASCEVVAVSSRSIAAAGCPGVGTIVLRPPTGTPRMRSQVIIRPGAALGQPSDRVASAAQVAEPDHWERKRDRDSLAGRRTKQRADRQGAAGRK